MGLSKNAREHKESLAELPQDERILKEYERLCTLYKKVSQDRLRLARKLISRAAFMSVTLGDLEIKITEEGVTSEYQNGENQWGTKKSPEVEVYNAMVKNYGAVIKQLCDLLPPEEKVIEDDGFEAFTGRR